MATDRVSQLLRTGRQEDPASVAASSRGAAFLDKLKKQRPRDNRRTDIAPPGALRDNDATPRDAAPLGAAAGSPDTSPPVSIKEAKAAGKRAPGPNPFRQDRLRPVQLMRRLGKEFGGLEWASWEPENLWHAIHDRHGSEPSEAAKDMIGALRALANTESFWHEPHVFFWIVAALNGRRVDFRTYPDIEPCEIAYALRAAESIRGADAIAGKGGTAEGVSFGPEVGAAAAAVFMEAGFVHVPWMPAADEEVASHLDESALPLREAMKAGRPPNTFAEKVQASSVQAVDAYVRAHGDA